MLHGCLQLKQSLLGLHSIASLQGSGEGQAAGSPLDDMLSSNAVAQTRELLEQLKQEEAALQQRVVEIDAVQQYEQVRQSLAICLWFTLTQVKGRRPRRASLRPTTNCCEDASMCDMSQVPASLVIIHAWVHGSVTPTSTRSH